MNKKIFLGIDLGTSNSVVARCDENYPAPQLLPITQLQRPGVCHETASLPSALYIPFPDEFPADFLQLPWANSEVSSTNIIGSFAREHGTKVPSRYVQSAKSWLCASNIDRMSDILPWNSSITSGKCSPFEASKQYLHHIFQSLSHQLTISGEMSLADAEIVLTVPASFDEVARNLTFTAAEQSGLPAPRLLEEPLAAFYAWLARHEQDWRTHISPGDLVLVCDLGGGTTDFSMIAVLEKNGELALERVSVGEHILLGGDNMDLALAYTLKFELEESGEELDEDAFMALNYTVRQAKERMFAETELESLPISVAGSGSSLFDNTISTTLRREHCDTVLLEGFFPKVSCNERAANSKRTALQEFGLNYASEPAITRHIASFLHHSYQIAISSPELWSGISENCKQHEPHLLMPTAVLFNGGVFKADCFRNRIIEQLADWAADSGSPDQPRELPGAAYDTAVALGAAWYAKLRASKNGLRIKAGTARSYYIGIESSAPAVPGFKLPLNGVCVVPQGMEEGSSVVLPDKEFGLQLGEKAVFRFFSSSERGEDKPGTVVKNAERNLEELARIEVELSSAGAEGETYLPVHLISSINDLGTLELKMKHTASENFWKLEFQVRSAAGEQ
ncbi:MAG: Hsp70 family protein [bacterium]|nr:Hsp70 family protein [bacterium]